MSWRIVEPGIRIFHAIVILSLLILPGAPAKLAAGAGSLPRAAA